MLATLERPIEGLAGPTTAPPGRRPPRLSAAPVRAHLRVLDAVPPLPAEPPAIIPVSVVPLPRVRVMPAAPVPAGSAQPVRAARRAALPVRLTMRARRLLAGLVLLCAGAVGVLAVDVLSAVVPVGPGTYAAQEAPYLAEGSADSAGLVAASGSSITVGAGDTLWSLAEQVDPEADPRDVIAAIMILNDLDTSSLQAGQVLRVP